MEYVLTGFSQDKNIRWFAFDGISDERRRLKFMVGVDISLIRKYAISLQELPLLCLHLLEGQAAAGRAQQLTFTEADMAAYADRRTAAQLALEERKMHRKPPSNRVGVAWRSQRPVPPGT
jgi:hypothetical protein